MSLSLIRATTLLEIKTSYGHQRNAFRFIFVARKGLKKSVNTAPPAKDQ
jgi:hypothetical protein